MLKTLRLSRHSVCFPSVIVPFLHTTPEEFELWINGKTGYPLVDANMRELRATGWMSNRGRQNVASFLILDLQVLWARTTGGQTPDKPWVAIDKRTVPMEPLAETGKTGRHGQMDGRVC